MQLEASPFEYFILHAAASLHHDIFRNNSSKHIDIYADEIIEFVTALVHARRFDENQLSHESQVLIKALNLSNPQLH